MPDESVRGSVPRPLVDRLPVELFVETTSGSGTSCALRANGRLRLVRVLKELDPHICQKPLTTVLTLDVDQFLPQLAEPREHAKLGEPRGIDRHAQTLSDFRRRFAEQ